MLNSRRLILFRYIFDFRNAHEIDVVELRFNFSPSLFSLGFLGEGEKEFWNFSRLLYTLTREGKGGKMKSEKYFVDFTEARHIVCAINSLLCVQSGDFALPFLLPTHQPQFLLDEEI